MFRPLQHLPCFDLLKLSVFHLLQTFASLYFSQKHLHLYLDLIGDSSDENMNGSKKRKRVITACVECYRRKQRCDRKQPCNICSARNVKCSYLDSDYGPPGPQLLESPPLKRKIDDKPEVPEGQRPRELSEQVGYSQRNESNSLKILEKSLPSSAPNLKPSRSLLVNYLKDKYSATVGRLPKPTIMNELVDLFFVDANAHVGVLDRYFFHKAEASWNSVNEALVKNFKLEGVSREVLYFPAVLFQVLAVSVQYLTLESKTTKLLGLDSYLQLDQLSEKYTQHGMEIMKLLGRHSPTVMSVQHDLMRAFWAKNCSNGTESWYILGDAIRQAQDLGLHLRSDVPDQDGVEKTLENLWYDEWKKRLFLSLFNWDAHMALVLGRPRSINAGDCTVDVPLDCNMPDSPRTTVPTKAALNRTPSQFTRHIFNNFISHKTHEMLSLGANRRYLKDYSIVTRLQGDVIRRLEELPPTSRPSNPDRSWDTIYPYLPKQREHILTFANSFLVALHRPHASVHEESRKVAILASLTTLESQQRLFEMMTPNHYRTFGASFYTIDAGLFVSTAILENPISDRNLLARIQTALAEAIRRLNVMKHRSPMAESGVKMLERCFEKIKFRQPRTELSPSTDRLSFTPQETPSLASASGQSEQSSWHLDGGIVDAPPAYTDFEWAFPANGADSNIDLDLIGNVTDFNTSFWTDSMASILDSNADPNESDASLWQFLVA